MADASVPSVPTVADEPLLKLTIKDLYKNKSSIVGQLSDTKSLDYETICDPIVDNDWFGEEQFSACIRAIEGNLFRPLSSDDLNWTDRKLVYLFTFQLFEQPKAQITNAIVDTYVTDDWLLNLIKLFESDDSRAHPFLLKTLHKIYARYKKVRPRMIGVISSYLHRIVEFSDFNPAKGVDQILELLVSIIDGLVLPIKESWLTLLKDTLIPLFKCRDVKKFEGQLAYCCKSYVRRDIKCGIVILECLLQQWPKYSMTPDAEVSFIQQIWDTIDIAMDNPDFSFQEYKDTLVLSLNQLCDCLLSTDESVVEKAVFVWKQKKLQTLIDNDVKLFLPKLAETISQSRSHKYHNLVLTVDTVYASKYTDYWRQLSPNTHNISSIDYNFSTKKDDTAVDSLCKLFPQFSRQLVTQTLAEHHGNVEKATVALLNPKSGDEKIKEDEFDARPPQSGCCRLQ